MFRYLAGTEDHGILFGPNPTTGVVGYTYSDFAGCMDNRKSTTGYCFRFVNGAISWKSKLQQSRGVVNRFMHNPGRSHWNAIKHVFRYLAGTKDHGILFGPNSTSGLVGYTDSDFAGCVDNRKSTTGYCFRFVNGAISWKSKLQDYTTTSTTEAKYVAASDAAKDALWLGRLAHTFRQVNSNSAPVINSDPGCCCFVEKSGSPQRLQAY